MTKDKGWVLRALTSPLSSEPVVPPFKRQTDMYCFRYLKMGRLGVLESFLKFSPNLQNSEPPSSESKERVLRPPPLP